MMNHRCICTLSSDLNGNKLCSKPNLTCLTLWEHFPHPHTSIFVPFLSESHSQGYILCILPIPSPFVIHFSCYHIIKAQSWRQEEISSVSSQIKMLCRIIPQAPYLDTLLSLINCTTYH